MRIFRTDDQLVMQITDLTPEPSSDIGNEQTGGPGNRLGAAQSMPQG